MLMNHVQKWKFIIEKILTISHKQKVKNSLTVNLFVCDVTDLFVTFFNAGKWYFRNGNRQVVEKANRTRIE